jgi:hypothetical protein
VTTSEITAARAALHGQLVRYVADVLDADRVHQYRPQILVTPCIWIGQPGVTTQDLGAPGARVRLVRFDVCALGGGYDPDQQVVLDELVARIWDAAYDLKRAEAVASVPQPVDVGGTNQSAVVTAVDVTVLAHSLCTRPPAAVPVP